MPQNDDGPTWARVLWADDDALDNLSPVGRLLSNRGLVLTAVTDYHAALDCLRGAADGPPIDRFTGLLVDTMLPPSIQHVTVGNNLGIELAQAAAKDGNIRSIAFCSVVPYAEVAARFEVLASKYQDIRFNYFQKIELFDGHRLDQLAKALLSRMDPR